MNQGQAQTPSISSISVPNQKSKDNEDLDEATKTTFVKNDPSFHAEEEWSRNVKGLYEKYVYPFDFEFQGKKFRFYQDNVMKPEDLGKTVWDGSIVLGTYLANSKIFPSDYWKNKRVIEVGSGVGVTGIIVATLGSEVTLTDLQDLVPLLEKNASANQTSEFPTIKVKAHHWGDDVSCLNPPFDAILAAECIYYEELVEPLCKSLLELSNPSTSIYVAYEAHNEIGAKKVFRNYSKIF